MTVENTSTVDAVGTDKETGEVRLSIFDHLPWDTEHLRLLQDKINVYLGFIESGEIYVSYPNAKGRPLVIDVHKISAVRGCDTLPAASRSCHRKLRRVVASSSVYRRLRR
jgi:hypothetical protein